MSYVEGSYATPNEAIAAVKRLEKEGYKKKDLRLISNTAARHAFMEQSNLEITSENDYKKESGSTAEAEQYSIWDTIIDAFSADEDGSAESTVSKEDPLSHYQNDIANGNIIILVEEENAETKTDSIPNDVTENEQTIKLQEEQLDVDTNKVQTGEVNVSKRVIEETKMIEVPVEHEEIVIKRHKVNDGTSVDENNEDEEIVIPISEEQIHVTKTPVVIEEVTIGKETVEETKQISETVRKEDIEVETDGDVDLHDDRNL